MEMHPDVTKIIYSTEEISQKIASLGKQISQDYNAEEGIILVSVLRGAAIYSSDLARQISIPVEMDYMAVSSYGAATKSSGVVKIQKDLSSPIEGRDILIAEDILDSGLTLAYLIDLLKQRNPKSITVVPLFVKEGAQKVEIDCRYEGLPVPNEFVVGFGLDYAERYRNLPYLGVLDPKVYSK